MITLLVVWAVSAAEWTNAVWSAVGGAAVVAWGTGYRYSRIREPWAGCVSSEGVSAVQDARGRVTSLAGMVVLVGSLIAVPVVLAFA